MFARSKFASANRLLFSVHRQIQQQQQQQKNCLVTCAESRKCLLSLNCNLFAQSSSSSSSSNSRSLTKLSQLSPDSRLSLSSSSYSFSSKIHTSSGLFANSNDPNETNNFQRVVTGPASSGEKAKPKSVPNIRVVFQYDDGRRIEAKGRVGDTLLDVVIDNEIDLDGFGACEGTLACSTCHLILSQEDYDRIPNKPSDEEMDMLDLAYDLTDTSRLGCQIYLTKDFDGLVVKVPETINDARTS